MKKFKFLIYFSLLGVILTFVSCKEDTEGNSLFQPLLKDMEMVVYAVKDEAKDVTQSRGLLSNADFDLKYDPDILYLHVIGSNATVGIPLSSKKLCESVVDDEGNTEKRECKCFSYRIEQLEDGSTKVTPFLEDGSLSTESLTIPKDNKGCYFSSVPESVWELPSENITPVKAENSNEVIYAKFERDDVNKEVYRSAENFSVDELIDGLDLLIMHRACAGFNLVGLFYDGQEYIQSEEPTFIEFDEDEFEEIMGSPVESWYIKIYIGGSTFADKYDYGTMQACGDYQKGYYSTGDFQTFESKNFGYNLYYLESYGYYTPKKQQLFTPALGETVDVYILIKHWDGDDEPSEEWLASDDDALYTRMNITGGIQPINNCFYILGLLMDARQFKIAWDNAVEAKANEASTISRSAKGMRFFSVENAKIICEKY